MVTNVLGEKVPDLWSANNKLPSNWYYFFVTQAIQYLLGNGVEFQEENTKDKLGKNFDRKIKEIALYAKHAGRAYGFWDFNHLAAFKFTEFVPLYDENTGVLRGGIRFWQLDKNKPINITLYEEDGYTEYQQKNAAMTEIKAKRGYVKHTKSTKIDGVYGEEFDNYSTLPIFEMRNVNKQSELFGNKEVIDAYDLTLSQLTNNADEGALIYWVFKNAGGFEDDMSLERAIEKIHTVHGINIDEDANAEPHTVQAPYEILMATLERLERQMYHNFMALKVEEISAGNVTATQIDAAYEPINEKSDQFEDYVSDFINNLLEMLGIDDEPSYTRSRIANKSENIQNTLASAQYMGQDFTIRRLAMLFDVPDMAEEIIKQQIADEMNRFEETENE